MEFAGVWKYIGEKEIDKMKEDNSKLRKDLLFHLASFRVKVQCR